MYTERWFWPWLRGWPQEEKRYQNYIELISLFSILLIHLANFHLKFYSLIKRNVYFPTTLFKNLIFEEHCVLLFCMRKFCILLYLPNFVYFDLISWFRVKNFLWWFIFVVEDNFFIDWIYKIHLQIHTHVFTFWLLPLYFST